MICDTLSVDEYETLCDQHGVDSSQRDGSLWRLNDLGVMLYFGDDVWLDLNVVLNPFWVTEGILSYLLITNQWKKPGEGMSKTNPGDFDSISGYPSGKAMYILDMMCKFELWFALDETQTLFLLQTCLHRSSLNCPF